MTLEHRTEAPAVDVVRDGDTLRVEIDAPGVRDFVLTTRNNSLIIDATRPLAPHGEFLVHERVRVFHREVDLPAETDVEHLSSALHDGVIVVRAPLAAHHAAVCHPDAAAI